MTPIQYLHVSFELWGAVFGLICIVTVYATRYFEKKLSDYLVVLFLMNSLRLLSDSLAWYFRGSEGVLGYYTVRIANFLVFILSFAVLSAFAGYVTCLVEIRRGKSNERLCRAVYALSMIGALLVIGSRIFGYYYYFDGQNFYHRGSLYFLHFALGFMILIIIWLIVFPNLKYMERMEKYAVVGYFALPAVAIIIQTFKYGVSFIDIADTIALIMVFVSYELQYTKVCVRREQELSLEKQRLLEEQVKLKESRIRLFQGQIKPHFIYNMLTVLWEICSDNPKAVELIRGMSKYLRGSANLLDETQCITIDKELETAENYLYLIKERFGGNISSEISVENKGFMLPAFTIQTLVENAVTHGIRKNKDGQGSVLIHVYADSKDNIIEVKDDGVGFDTGILEHDDGGERHVGIYNLRNRLELMSGGSLDIESVTGEGTKATVRIPKTPPNPSDRK